MDHCFAACTFSTPAQCTSTFWHSMGSWSLIYVLLSWHTPSDIKRDNEMFIKVSYYVRWRQGQPWVWPSLTVSTCVSALPPIAPRAMMCVIHYEVKVRRRIQHTPGSPLYQRVHRVNRGENWMTNHPKRAICAPRRRTVIATLVIYIPSLTYATFWYAIQIPPA